MVASLLGSDVIVCETSETTAFLGILSCLSLAWLLLSKSGESELILFLGCCPDKTRLTACVQNEDFWNASHVKRVLL